MSLKSITENEARVSTITTSGSEYEVFLSFRGLDTRLGFTDHLYVRLIDAGIRTYRDDKDLKKGENIGPELLKAIKDSKIAIPILSKGYAASKWCLRELAQIVECKRSNGLIVMPIFYDVTPSEVCNQTGDYAKAFKSYEGCHDDDAIKSWKAALREVGELSGWDIHTNRLKEGKLVKDVIRVVLHELKKAYLVVTDYLVGVEHHVKEILSMSSADTNAVQIIGIHGMGGIGKTTIAKVIYNHLLPNFEIHSFLANIRETSQSKGMKFLYERLIDDVLSEGSGNISNDDEGINIIRRRFSNKKVVILLDDVDKISQLDGFIGKRDFFGHGSRIIVTTRNKSILDSFKVDCSYELGGLKTCSALQLFCKHAFRQNNPPEEYSILSKRAVETAAGLPLALEVFGSHLCGKSSKVWESILNKLEKVPHQEICGKLSVSYEALDVQQKQIFLDIACFFIGEDYRIVIYFWEESKYPEEAMDVLQQMSLIKIQKDHTLWMHDQLRDLGREIVREEHKEPGKRNRLWHEREATELFLKNKGDENIEGICLRLPGPLWNDYISSDKFASLPNLRLLRVYYNYKDKLESVVSESYPPFPKRPLVFSKLRWFKWRDFPPMHDAENFSFENLAILDLSWSNITSSWGGWSGVKMAKNLKVLNLTHCTQLVKTPDLSCHLLLEQLILEGCWQLVEIDKSIIMLQHLVIINLKGCRCLKKLPQELSCMESLEELIIEKTGIVEIPNWPLMRRLRVLDFSGCVDLKKVSSFDFAVDNNITELSLEGSKITILPDSIGKLVKLQKLSLEWCRKIKTLPESIGDLVSLVELGLQESGIVELPHTIGNLRNLNTLTIGGTPLKRLPTAIGMMENLLRIDARFCSKLRDIPKLPQSLISLLVSRARTPRIPDVSNLINLKHLELLLDDKPIDLHKASGSASWYIGKVINLETLVLRSKYIISLHEDLSMLSHLRTLELHHCTELQSISKLPSGLTTLDIYESGSLRTLINLPSSLTILKIDHCSSLETLPNLSHLKKLSSLEIYDAPIRTLKGLHSHELQKLVLRGCEVSEIDDLYMLKNLDELSIEGCVNLQSLSDLSSLKKLKHLEVRFCPNLVEIAGIDMLENLTSLYIKDCAKLQTLPVLSNLKKLKDLQVQSCPNLVEILGIDMLKNLEELFIEDCEKVQSLSDLSNLKKLKNLKVQNLVGNPGIEMLKNLEKLCILDCAKLQSLQGLPYLKKLKDLQVRSCPNLVKILGIDMLENLKNLSIKDCEKLHSLPDFSNLKKLQNFEVQSCPNLVEITGRLESLRRLLLRDCQSLEKFPDIPNCEYMEDFFIENCGKRDKSSLKLCTCVEAIHMHMITGLSGFFRCYLCNNNNLKWENSPDEQSENSLNVDSEDDDSGSA